MAIEFNCPHCGRLLTTSDDRAAATASCPSCGDPITVPGALATAGAPAAAFSQTGSWSAGPSSDASPAEAAFIGSQAPAAEQASTAAPAPELHASASCPWCGSQTLPGASYCPFCGRDLHATYEAPRYAPFWRRVVALFIDMVVVWSAEWVIDLFIPRRSWRPEQLGFVLWLLYYAVLESSREQATVGKRVLGIAVYSVDGRRLSFGRAAFRTLAKLASTMIFGVGFIMPLLTTRKQALHDILADAVVIRK